ncbi:MAG TPA: rhodanese-like domain-containing protein [Alphaproteobacteria bacterium]|nr:rhodanese-like domain-containing protein [Alphaproteobacteria bacterium]
MSQRYAGDVTPKEAWNILGAEKDSHLVDCRTTAEWSFVGVPDLSLVDKNTNFVEWVRFPGGLDNPAFVEEVEKAGIGKDATVLLLCRSGQRSIAAAIAMTESGFSKSYNILEGFEGDKNQNSQRGKVGGWKLSGLPWQQT